MGEIVYRAANDTHELTVMRSDIAENPREWDNLGTMVCFHGRYTLGDEHDYNSPGEFFLDLLENSQDELLADDGFTSRLYYFWKQEIVDNGDLADDLAIQFQGIMEDETYPKLGDEFPAARFGRMIAEADSAWIDEFLDDAEEGELQDILDNLDKYVILPLYLYDHSGITMSTGAFSCPWDSGQVGWIYAEKKKFIDETGCTEAELFSTDPHRVMANRAEQMLIDEVKTYDLYIRGECYGYSLVELNKCECCGHISEELIDSCGGFLTDSLKNLKEDIKCYLSMEFHDLVDSLEGRY